MKNIFNEKKDPVNYRLYQNFIGNLDFDTFRSDLMESIYCEVKNKIKLDLPEIYEDLKKTLESIKKYMNSLDETKSFILEKTAKIVDSNALCADIYKMRDEISNLKCDLNRFKFAIKNVFSDHEDEDDE